MIRIGAVGSSKPDTNVQPITASPSGNTTTKGTHA